MIHPVRRGWLKRLTTPPLGDLTRLPLARPAWRADDPAIIHHVLTANAGQFARVESEMDVLRRLVGDSVITSEGAVWTQRRRQLQEAFHPRRLSLAAEISVRRAAELGRRWTRQSRVADAQFEAACLSLSVFSEWLFGREAAEGPAVVAAAKALSSAAARGMRSGESKPRWPAGADAPAALAPLRKAAAELIANRTPGGAGPTELSEAQTLLFAGHHTVAAALAWTLESLAERPDWQARIGAEALAAGLPDGPGCLEMLTALPAARCAVQESLRLHPPAWTLFGRRALRSARLAGQRIAAGDLIFIYPVLVHRDPRWFDKPDEFDPSRFEAEGAFPPGAYLPFGLGPRSCLGANLAMVELPLLVATLLSRLAGSGLELARPAGRIGSSPLISLQAEGAVLDVRPRDTSQEKHAVARSR